jgi:hypothetical protein
LRAEAAALRLGTLFRFGCRNASSHSVPSHEANYRFHLELRASEPIVLKHFSGNQGARTSCVIGYAYDKNAKTQEITMSFGLYLLGYLFVIGGLTYVSTLMHVPVRWITAIDIVLAGIGIVTAVKATRQKDASN